MDANALLTTLDEATEERPRCLGSYNVVGRLGQGGMGAVYEAIDRRHGSRVALKTIRRDSPGGGRRIKAEFRVVADLVHENLVPVYELALAQTLWFFTMELVEGVSFMRWLRGSSASLASAKTPATTMASAGRRGQVANNSPLLPASPPGSTEEELRAAFGQLVRGVLALHDAGLRHGDIKPENVIVRADGHVVLVDFGLSSALPGTGGTTPAVGGTPTYMAPEQLRGEVIGPAADWYAVGIMLYVALTGRYPFGPSPTSDHYLQKMISAPPAPASLVDVPADLSALSLALLNPAAARRPGAADVAAHFKEQGWAHVRAPVRGRTSFVGRQNELRKLEQALAEAQRSRMVVAHAHGPSGIGKSSVVTSFLDGVRNVAEAKILRGRCYERESIPYKAFDHIVDELAGWLVDLDERAADILPERMAELAQVFPALRGVPAILERSRSQPATTDIAELARTAQRALAELFVALSRAVSPLVLSIDDLQWADAASAELLGVLLDVEADARILVLGSFRGVEAAGNPALREYFKHCEASEHVVDMPISALSESETMHMAKSILAGLSETVEEDTALSVVRESRGVPFLVEELARYVAAHPGRCEDLTLHRVVAERMRDLAADQQALLAVAAVADSPVSQPVIFAAAGLDATALPALLALRQASMMRWAGPESEAGVSTYHDGVREAVVVAIGPERVAEVHLQLARAHIAHQGETRVFDAVRHLAAAAELVEDPAERQEAARLHLAAGRRAKDGAAFALASRCFETGIAFLEDERWQSDYHLALGLHTGAAETAYLEADWDGLRAHVADIKAEGRGVLDQLVARVAEIDAYIGHSDYDAAIDVGCEALELLGVDLASDPTEEQVGAAFTRALAALSGVGVAGLLALPDVHDPRVAAAMRIQVRMSPAAYYSRPALLPVLASNLVVMSIERGLSPATPYALAVIGIVFNSLGMHPVAHEWGVVAEGLLSRWADRKLEVCTRHVLQCLVCTWMVPMDPTLDGLRAVFDMGRDSNDPEYGSYAAHGYVYNAINAARPLGPLLDEALELGQAMRSLGQVNAVHVHAPFEQVLRCLRGQNVDSARLDGHGFDEAAELAAATAGGSRHGLFVLHYTMGLVRFHFGDARDALSCFDSARLYIEAAASAWHVPILHQYSALAACCAWPGIEDPVRPAVRARIDESLAALDSLAGHCAVNFAHRVVLVEGAIAAMQGEHGTALETFGRAAELAEAGGWTNDVALALELSVLCDPDRASRQRTLQACKQAYATWGATAKVECLSRASRPGSPARAAGR